MRLIDADALVQNIDKRLFTRNEEYLSAQGSVIVSEIYNAPTIEATGWIPCSERLPSKGVAVLVNGIMYDAPPITISTDAPYYYEQGWINAWMPLPEPWKGADDEVD